MLDEINMKNLHCFIFAAAQEKPFLAGAGLNLIEMIPDIDFILELTVEGID
jgi:hypothetical protein